MLATLCVVLALIGLLLIVLGAVPATASHIPGGVASGVALFAVAVIGYAALYAVGAA